MDAPEVIGEDIKTNLAAAEAALVELSEECHGSCAWSDDGRRCPCNEEFWPAIERIRALQDGKF